MPSRDRDPYQSRVNRALTDLGCAVAIEVSPSGKQQRLSTPIPDPAGVEQARKLAEELGHDMELHRMGLDPFPFERWFADSQKPGGDAGDAISGKELGKGYSPQKNSAPLPPNGHDPVVGLHGLRPDVAGGGLRVPVGLDWAGVRRYGLCCLNPARYMTLLRVDAPP